VQVWPQPVRRRTSDTGRPSAATCRATSANAVPEHSQRVMGRSARSRQQTSPSGGGRAGIGWAAIEEMIVKSNFNFKSWPNGGAPGLPALPR